MEAVQLIRKIVSHPGHKRGQLGSGPVFEVNKMGSFQILGLF